MIAVKNSDADFSFFPECVDIRGEGDIKMKVLKQIFIMMFMVVGLSLAVSAQKDDKKQDKPKPPVIKPGDKPPRPNPSDKPKKPNISFFVLAKAEDVTTAD